MNKKLIIVDADGFAYHSLRETLEESLQAMEEKIQNMFQKTQAAHYTMCISKGNYFRNEVYPVYKEFRKKYRIQSWVKTLKAVLEEKYNAIWMKGVEADDLCAYLYLTTKDKENTILCSPDKDLLTNIPSLNIEGHFNYSYTLVDKENPDSLVRGWWISTSAEEANYNFWVSMIAGDTSDGISGIPKKGPKFAEKLLSEEDYHKYPSLVLDAYITHYGLSQGIFEFQKTYRALWLLVTEDDYIREVGITPATHFENTYETISHPTPQSLW